MITDEVKARMRAIAARYPQPRSAMLPCLHLAQQTEGYITAEGAQAVAEAVGAERGRGRVGRLVLLDVHDEPLGAQVIKVCTSISCYLRGATRCWLIWKSDWASSKARRRPTAASRSNASSAWRPAAWRRCCR